MAIKCKIIDGKKICREEMPTFLKVLAILYLVGAIISVILGLILIIGGSSIIALWGNIEEYQAVTGLIFAFAWLGGILLLGAGVLNFFLWRGLKKAQKWSRIVIIITNAIAILSAVYSLFNQQGFYVLNILWSGFIIYYMFTKKVKDYFGV